MNRIEVADPRSSDPTDHRRVHAVPPTLICQGETKILDSLLKEAHMTPSLKNTVAPTPIKNKEDDDRRLQKMLEKYQKEMKMQLQRSNNRLSESSGRAAPISHSQPCLIASGSRSSEITTDVNMNMTDYQRRASASGDQALEVPIINQGNQRNTTSNQKLVQSLRDENLHLKKELETIKKSLLKLQQIEYSYSKLEKEYEILSNERRKQENLEHNAMMQMEKTLKKLTIEKEELQSRLEKASTEPAVVANLMLNEIQQRQELFACKERQKLEIEAQNQTLEEQRNHIAMLEKALANSQERLAKREKKCDELNAMASQTEELRKQLKDVWEEHQKREQFMEAERAQWEMENTQLRMQLNKDSSISGSLKRTSTPGSTEDLLRLRKNLQTKDDKILQLETIVNELRKTLSEENDRRKVTLTTINESFETRIKKLEEETLDRDLIINELKQERDRFANLFEKNSGDETLNRMEEIRQKLQERKKKGRLGITGGLVGIGDHRRSSSGSIVKDSLHGRSSSGPFEHAASKSNTTYSMYKSQVNN